MRRIWMIAYCLLLVPDLFAQDAGGSVQDLRQNIETGQTVTVSLTDGQQMDGAVLELMETALTITTAQGTEVVPAVRIREVSQRRNDPLWNGLVTGAIVGVLLGVISNAANDCNPNECGEAFVVPFSTAIGAAAGAGVDALLRQREVLYRAGDANARLDLLPGAVAGARISWRF